MSLIQFVLILRARWLIVAVILVLALSAAVTLSLVLPPRYTASTFVVLDFKGMDPILGVTLPATLMPGYIATQVDIIQSHKVATDVVLALRLGEGLAVREQWQDATEGKGKIEDWLADLLLKKLDVRPSRESSVVEIAWTGTDPQFAATIADAFADVYIKTSLELRVEPARQSANWFDDRIRTLRANVEKTQIKLNEYQRQKGFTATDERLDLENARLGELSAQYSAAQGQAADAQSRQNQLKEFVARGANPNALPDILANPLLQSLKGQLGQSESRLEQISSQLGKNHPEVQRLQADIQKQRQKLLEEVSTVASGINNGANVAQRRETELRNALAEQKARLLRLSQGRDEMTVLMKEVETAQHAYDAAAQRFSQTNLESQASQTQIAVLTRAVPPLSSSFPKLPLNCALALAAGTIIGLGLAVLVELLDQRVRSAEDLAVGFDSPVLGSLEKSNVSPRGFLRRRLRLRAPAPVSAAA
jgi:chain length determinant protein EpsF